MPQEPPALPPPPPEAPPPAPARGVSISGVTGFTFAGLGLIGAAIGGGLVLSADASLWSTCGASCSDAQLSELATAALIADVSLGVALAGAIAGVLGLLLEDTTPGETQVAIVPSSDGVRLALAGRLP